MERNIFRGSLFTAVKGDQQTVCKGQNSLKDKSINLLPYGRMTETKPPVSFKLRITQNVLFSYMSGSGNRVWRSTSCWRMCVIRLFSLKPTGEKGRSADIVSHVRRSPAGQLIVSVIILKNITWHKDKNTEIHVENEPVCSDWSAQAPPTILHLLIFEIQTKHFFWIKREFGLRVQDDSSRLIFSRFPEVFMTFWHFPEMISDITQIQEQLRSTIGLSSSFQQSNTHEILWK